MNERDFFGVITTERTQIGYIPGSQKVLFIKTGQGGSVYGDMNVYLNLATEVHEKRNLSVFVSATVRDKREDFLEDMRVVEQRLGTSSFEMYYLGVSKGGLIGCWYGSEETRILKMLCINAPLMINFHNKTLPAVKKMGKEKLTMIYGSLDPSYRYLPFVEKHTNVHIINGADHNLKNTSVTLLEIVNTFCLDLGREE